MFKRNRFTKRGRDFFILRDIIFPAALVLAAVILLVYGMEALGKRTEAERLESARSAVIRAAVQCYALEGRYPLSISYLTENYGLSVDTDKFVVHYQAFASNIMPDIDVYPIGMDHGQMDDDWDDWDWG
ncbi:MAG: hypothetical protein FWH02_01280 [Oscillospiraceae bacterium]|nr:hypothetical protein [Oscillospiraceae bacterium]